MILSASISNNLEKVGKAMTRLERAKAIRDRIFALPEEIWSPITGGEVDPDLMLQPGWSAVVTAQSSPEFGGESGLIAREKTGAEANFPFAYVLDVWLTGKGKVLSLNCGYVDKLISMRPGPWEQEVFGIPAH